LHRIGRVGELAEGASKVVVVERQAIALFCYQGRFFAIDDVCPHMGASLAAGYLEDDVVSCPLHYWRFRITDGTWADNPRIKIGSYPVHVEGDELMLELPSPPASQPGVSLL